MDFRRKRLFLALGIVMLGTTVALVWCAWQGWGLGRGFPYNTILFDPADRFEDFLIHAHATASPTPYLERTSAYFPFAYVVLRPLPGLNPLIFCWFYLGVGCMTLWRVLSICLRPILAGPWENVLVSTAMLGFSYPLLITVDRGNLELVMAVLIGAALLCFQARSWGLGLGFLLPAICLKFYPVVLLSLFLRPRHLLKIVGMVAAFLFVTTISMASFQGTVVSSWRLWQANLAFFNKNYVIENYGLAGGASPWNTGKAVALTLGRLKDDSFDVNAISLRHLIEITYHGYLLLELASILAVIAFSVFIEREFFRRAILLLLLMTMIAPNGADYRLLFVQMALCVLVLVPTQRRHDLLIAALLALAIVPKKEIHLTYLGATDTSYADVPIGVLITPPLLLVTMALLISDGIEPGVRKWATQRLRGILAALSVRRLIPKARTSA